MVCVLATFTFLEPALAATANKVDICHYPPGNLGNTQDITISENALAAHLDHGDLLGACAVPQVCAVGEVCASPSNLCAIGGCNGPLPPPPPPSCPCWYTDGANTIADSLFGGTVGSGPAEVCVEFAEPLQVVALFTNDTARGDLDTEKVLYTLSLDRCAFEFNPGGFGSQVEDIRGEEHAECARSLEVVPACGFAGLP